jgi:hypothetical protein
LLYFDDGEENIAANEKMKEGEVRFAARICEYFAID